MAGQGARFGYRFKPFLTVRNSSFIEAAFAPFRPWLARIDKIYFIMTRARAWRRCSRMCRTKP